jgi:hypothetical protein
MSVGQLRRLLSVLIVSAYFGATMFVPTVSAAPASMDAGMMHQQDGMGDKMPCKGKMSSCMTEIGCIFMISLPSSNLTVSTFVRWSPVSYVVAPEYLAGRSIKPALSPPISRT